MCKEVKPARLFISLACVGCGRWSQQLSHPMRSSLPSITSSGSSFYGDNTGGGSLSGGMGEGYCGKEIRVMGTNRLGVVRCRRDAVVPRSNCLRRCARASTSRGPGGELPHLALETIDGGGQALHGGDRDVSDGWWWKDPHFIERTSKSK